VPASGDDLSGGLEPLFEQCEAVHEQAREIERQPLEQAQQRRTEAPAAAILEQARSRRSALPITPGVLAPHEAHRARLRFL
jgi:hypothetical protein